MGLGRFGWIKISSENKVVLCYIYIYQFESFVDTVCYILYDMHVMSCIW